MPPIQRSFSPTCHYRITTKESSRPYQNSLALHTNENPSDIIANRQNLHLSSTPLHYIAAHQIHSNRIEIIREQNSHGWHEKATIECDGLITDQKNVVLAILTADCVPILLYDTTKEVIGAVHAGWKGTQQQIVQETIKQMQQHFDTNPKDIVAYIAPSIGQCCYEVGEDVALHFEPTSYKSKGEKFMLDLPHANQQQLLNMGIPQSNITLSNICTSCEVERFFSYRKECGCSGRFMSMIWMES
ncbi:MAG: peptidoglycan editing factor PgeF [Campylobacterales bacterium]|nr:peptidoglycan editing factor PgeF [Campylobacterales bacterium]